jgi:NADPH-dependent 2,4-dienoyl-CoA reductase/sulfur reductase-like enzyme
LVRSGFGGSVTVVSDDPDAPYDRTFCSKQYLIGMKSRPESMLADLGSYKKGGAGGAVLWTKAQALSIDTAGKTVLLDSGDRLDFDALILATGAEPKRPRLPGLDLPNVHVLRTLRDADAIIGAAEHARSVAIVGASFIGLEVAASLKQRKLEVSVVSPEEIPLGKLLGPEIGKMIRQVHEEKGVHFHLGRQVQRFEGTRLMLDDGSIVKADFVVLGVGVTPRTALATAAGLSCASAKEGGGVIVDERLESSVAGIFAIGDIAHYPDPHSGTQIRVEHWVHAERQGQHVAQVLMNRVTRYTDVPFFWSAHFDTGLRYLGHVSSIADSRTEGSIEGRNFTVSQIGEAHEKAFISCNRDLSALQIEAQWDRALR